MNITVFLSQFVFTDYELQNYLTVVSMILMIYGIKQLFINYILARKIVALLLIIFCIIILIIK